MPSKLTNPRPSVRWSEPLVLSGLGRDDTAIYFSTESEEPLYTSATAVTKSLGSEPASHADVASQHASRETVSSLLVEEVDASDTTSLRELEQSLMNEQPHVYDAEDEDDDDMDVVPTTLHAGISDIITAVEGSAESSSDAGLPGNLPNSFIRFRNAYVRDFKETHPGSRLPATTILSKQIGQAWKALSEDEKRPYFEAFKEDKRAFEEAHPGVKYPRVSRSKTKKVTPLNKATSRPKPKKSVTNTVSLPLAPGPSVLAVAQPALADKVTAPSADVSMVARSDTGSVPVILLSLAGGMETLTLPALVNPALRADEDSKPAVSPSSLPSFDTVFGATPRYAERPIEEPRPGIDDSLLSRLPTRQDERLETRDRPSRSERVDREYYATRLHLGDRQPLQGQTVNTHPSLLPYRDRQERMLYTNFQVQYRSRQWLLGRGSVPMGYRDMSQTYSYVPISHHLMHRSVTITSTPFNLHPGVRGPPNALGLYNMERAPATQPTVVQAVRQPMFTYSGQNPPVGPFLGPVPAGNFAFVEQVPSNRFTVPSEPQVGVRRVAGSFKMEEWINTSRSTSASSSRGASAMPTSAHGRVVPLSMDPSSLSSLNDASSTPPVGSTTHTAPAFA